MMNDQIRHIMSHNPKVIGPDKFLTDVSELIESNRNHHVAVVEDGKLLGLITTYDLWKKRLNSSDYRNLRAKDVMNTNLCKISPKDKVGTAAELLMDRRFHALPVVNLKGELKGVITSHDIIKYTLNREYKTPILYKDVLTDALVMRN